MEKIKNKYRKAPMYLVVYTIKHEDRDNPRQGPTFEDHYETFETPEQAEDFYNELDEGEIETAPNVFSSLYTASICLPIISTDYDKI